MAKKKEISNIKIKRETIVLDFSFPTSLISVSVNGFNNFLKDDNSAFKHLNYCLNELADKLSEIEPSKINDRGGLGKHSHVINDDNKLKIIENAVIESYKIFNPNATVENAKNFYDQNLKENTLYQLGLSGSLRLIGFFERYHHFKVVLIDYHHSLYPSVKYNDIDYDKFNICFYCRGKRL